MELLKPNTNINFNSGLNNEEVKERIRNNQINTTLTKTSKTYTKIFVENICTWFNLICFLLAALLISVESYQNITFVIIFSANLLIGLIQEIRAKKMVDKISVINKTKIKALRESVISEIEIEKIVKDDILFFESGNQVCADCVLIDGSCEVNESLITGESKPIRKKSGDSLYGGSYLISGSCKVQAVKVGLETYSSSLIKKAREFKKNQSEILKTLNFIIKTIGFLLIPFGILTFLDSYSRGNFKSAIIASSGSIIGMMPVGMFLLTSVSLVVGVLKLAKHKTLVQDLYSIEMLARTNILCLDKTGTITDGTMKVINVLPIRTSKENVKELIKNYLGCFNSNNQTQKALIDYFGVEKNFQVDNVIQFSSERKFSAVSFIEKGTYILGASEFATKNIPNDISKIIKEFSNEGYRVLVLCKNKNKIINDKITINSNIIAIITIQDNIRKDAEATIKWFNQNGVQVKIISGDNVNTVSSISKKVGIINAENAISLDGLNEKEVSLAALKYNVFGRVTPEQKLIIIKALKNAGSKVAMTGDGVNDILALKEADCSIAMASGSEATRSSSNLVMLENNFSSMTKIVSEGRRVINNISKASSLFLTKTFFTMFLTIFVLVSPSYTYPLQANQILLWETFFIGIPSFFLALQPNNEKVSGSFIASLTSKALPGAISLFLAALACYIYCSLTGNMANLATIISYSVTFGAFFILFILCLPLNKFRSIVSFSLLIGCFLSFIIVPKGFFNYAILTSNDLLFIFTVLVSILIVYVLLKLLFEKFFQVKFKKEKKK